MSDNRIVKTEHIDEWKSYNTKRIDRMEEKVDEMHAIVTNGLVDKVATLWQLACWLLAGIITALVGIITTLITLIK